MDAELNTGFPANGGSTEIALRKALLEFELALLKERVVDQPGLRKLLHAVGQGFTVIPGLEGGSTTGNICEREGQAVCPEFKTMHGAEELADTKGGVITAKTITSPVDQKRVVKDETVVFKCPECEDRRIWQRDRMRAWRKKK